ncbi:lysozyme-like domain containing protein [Marinobacter salicampi]|uniref:transglycosylase SLT domain-containing protein n=1 Tax=Marinobacter salicampi TaxID=435907 RepID=UPI001A952007|nr:lysozyme-like domain containing protein [Marinobacter salicampi]
MDRLVLKNRLRHRVLPVVFIMLLAWLIGGFEILVPAPPQNQNDICEIFSDHPDWYDYARASEQRWGIPIPIQMAFVHYESSFRSHVRPPRTRLFGLIPWARPSTAYGYAQALDPAWADYMKEAGGLYAQRTQMQHALDFIGWYNHKSLEGLDIAPTNAHHLYLAYHEGRTGYLRGSFRNKPSVQKVARRVAAKAASYTAQLPHCEAELRCRRFYQFPPFCS